MEDLVNVVDGVSIVHRFTGKLLSLMGGSSIGFSGPGISLI